MCKFLKISLFLSLIVQMSFAQVEFVITGLPVNTPYNATIYIAGNFNGWNPGDPDFALTKNADSLFSIVMSQTGTIEFKFTRGSWETVEGDADGHFIQNRTYTFSGDTVAYFEILSWEDLGGANPVHTTTSNVSIVNEEFYMPQLGRTRRIWIYLPLDYETSGKSYPVIYMHDGQNLFDDYTSFVGEWGVDESLNEIDSIGDNVPIVVGIDNGGDLRIDELSPWINTEYGAGGEGNLYMQFIVETLKPFIDANYRTLPDRENTGLIGSSLGGLISLYGGLKYPEVFSKLGLFSPAFWFNDSIYNYAASYNKEFSSKFYFIAGALEGDEMVDGIQAMYDTLINNSFTTDDIKMLVHNDGQHSEWYWKREFPPAYLWLFNNFAVKTGQVIKNKNFEIFPNPTTGKINISFENKNAYNLNCRLFNLSGKLLLEENIESSISLNLSSVSNGIYILHIICGEEQAYSKVVKF
ncbi:MAG: T9SS type A sorting domain-containing protein [Chlorobi bacterium]|nr:T9SS type A sorting domain-containing protein [Chlorobiota bacterium]